MAALAMRPSVLVDATTMLDVSGFAGIGRFVTDLLLGLEETRADWRSTLEVHVATAVDLRGRVSTTAELPAAVEGLLLRRGAEGDAIKWKRRLFMGRAARRFTLFHVPEARGMPLLPHPRTVVTCHDLIPLRMPRQYLGHNPLKVASRKAQDRFHYHRATRVVAISEKTKRELVSLLSVPEARIDVVPNGIHLDTWSAPSRGDEARRLDALGVGAHPFVVFVGSGDFRKGVAAMMRTLARARQTTDLELVWAGRHTARELELHREEAGKVGVLPWVRFLGFVSDEDLRALYRGALAHLFLSKLEGFGLSVVEAAASGCPVVLVRGSGADEILGDAAYQVEPDDDDAAFRALQRIAADPVERDAHVALGRARAATFSRARMALGYADVWRRALEATRR